MGIEENKEVVRRFIEAREKYDIPTIDELMSSDCVMHMPLRDLNRKQMMQIFGDTSGPVSVESATIEDIIAEGDKVSIKVTESGKNTGTRDNIEPTGKSVTILKFYTCRIQDGKIAEFWIFIDWLGLFQQLGFIPPTEEILKKAQDNTN